MDFDNFAATFYGLGGGGRPRSRRRTTAKSKKRTKQLNFIERPINKLEHAIKRVKLEVPDCSSFLSINPDKVPSDEIPPLIPRIQEKCEELEKFIENICKPLADVALYARHCLDKFNYFHDIKNEAYEILWKLQELTSHLSINYKYRYYEMVN